MNKKLRSHDVKRKRGWVSFNWSLFRVDAAGPSLESVQLIEKVNIMTTLDVRLFGQLFLARFGLFFVHVIDPPFLWFFPSA